VFAECPIDARLLVAAVAFQLFEHVGVEADGQLLLLRRPWDGRLREKGFVEWRDVRVVDVGIAHPVNPRQIAFDRFLVHGGFLNCSAFCSYTRQRMALSHLRFHDVAEVLDGGWGGEHHRDDIEADLLPGDFGVAGEVAGGAEHAAALLGIDGAVG
jgi:hypothetical protein